MNKLGVRAFSLVETLVAAAVISLAVLSVIAVVRKGQEQMWVERHRRTARGIVDSILEVDQYKPINYNAILNGTSTIGVNLLANLPATRSIIIDSQNNSGVPYKRIVAKVQWNEFATGKVDSVLMERWVPNIAGPFNVAPWAQTITSSSHFTGTLGGTLYDCVGWMAVDGIIGLRISGDWSGDWGWVDAQPWIDFRWAKTHSVSKLVLWCRVNPGPYGATQADVRFYKAGLQVSSFTVYNIPAATVRPSLSKTVFFSPVVMDEMRIQCTAGLADFRGFSEIELY